MTLRFLIFSLLILAFSCSNKANIQGVYYCEDCTVSKMTIDNEIIDLGLYGAGTYKIENQKIYINNPAGVLVYKIFGNDTIKGISHWVKDDTYVKLK